jgi:MFS family permease
LLTSASGAGALVSLLVIVPLTHAHHKPGWMLVGSMLWASAWLIVFGMSQSLPLSMFAIFCSFLGNPVVYTISVGISQLMAPPAMRARVISLFTLISFGMQPVGGVLLGLMAERVGVQPTIILSGILLFITVNMVLVTRPGLRAWVVTPKPAEPAFANARANITQSH